MEIKRLKLKKLNNTRDLGGLPLKDGRVIKSGILFRSGRLYKIPEKTKCAIRDMGISTVVDLRIDTEVEEQPDTKIEGINYVRLPIICTATAGITQDKKMRHTWMRERKRIKSEFGSSENYMKDTYKKIVFSDESVENFKKFFKILTEAEGGVLWHCAGGKDRAGVTAMLVEGILGADNETILQDYMASAGFQKRKFAYQKAALKMLPVNHDFKDILFAMMLCHEDYLSTVLNEIDEKYGSVEGFCRERLELSDEQINLLKDKYTEKS